MINRAGRVCWLGAGFCGGVDARISCSRLRLSGVCSGAWPSAICFRRLPAPLSCSISSCRKLGSCCSCGWAMARSPVLCWWGARHRCPAAACRLRRLWASSRRRWRSSNGQGRASMAAASSWLSGLSGTGGEPEATGVIAVELPVHPLNAAIGEGSPHHLQLLITDQWESLRHP